MSSNSLFTEIRSATHYTPLRPKLRRIIAIMHPTMVIHQNRSLQMKREEETYVHKEANHQVVDEQRGAVIQALLRSFRNVHNDGNPIW